MRNAVSGSHCERKYLTVWWMTCPRIIGSVMLSSSFAPALADSARDVLLQRVAQRAVRIDAFEVDPHVHDGAGDVRMDAGQGALGTQQANRSRHAQEVVRGLR